MILYTPLWNTMKEKGATTYTLQVKGGISSSTLQRLKSNQSVSLNTIDALCKILECGILDVVEYISDRDEDAI